MASLQNRAQWDGCEQSSQVRSKGRKYKRRFQNLTCIIHPDCHIESVHVRRSCLLFVYFTSVSFATTQFDAIHVSLSYLKRTGISVSSASSLSSCNLCGTIPTRSGRMPVQSKFDCVYNATEDELIIWLKEQRRLSWHMIAKEFARRRKDCGQDFVFPRTEGALQAHYSRTLSIRPGGPKHALALSPSSSTSMMSSESGSSESNASMGPAESSGDENLVVHGISESATHDEQATIMRTYSSLEAKPSMSDGCTNGVTTLKYGVSCVDSQAASPGEDDHYKLNHKPTTIKSPLEEGIDLNNILDDNRPLGTTRRSNRARITLQASSPALRPPSRIDPNISHTNVNSHETIHVHPSHKTFHQDRATLDDAEIMVQSNVDNSEPEHSESSLSSLSSKHSSGSSGRGEAQSKSKKIDATVSASKEVMATDSSSGSTTKTPSPKRQKFKAVPSFGIRSGPPTLYEARLRSAQSGVPAKEGKPVFPPHLPVSLRQETVLSSVAGAGSISTNKTSGWIPAEAEHLAKLKFTTAPMFVNCPPKRFIEYNTRSGSFRTRMRRPGDPPAVVSR